MEFRHLAEIAARQHGIVTIADCRMCGIPDRTVQRWANDGRLIRPHDGVFQIAGAPDSVEAGIYAAIRAAGDGAAASHRAAAYLWGLSEDVPIPEITVPYERAVVLDGVAVHRSRDLDGARLSIRRAILVTDPMRTLIDCGAVVGRGAVEDMLDTGLARQLFSHAAMECAYPKVARPDRHGSGTLRRILDTRALGAARADSLLEP
ncbi:MAG: type IV toxin-antitoxin system AbiEi family antitoxin domain-containing protein, partial [Acidimicrobiales bacterium]